MLAAFLLLETGSLPDPPPAENELEGLQFRGHPHIRSCALGIFWACVRDFAVPRFVCGPTMLSQRF